MPVPTDTAMAFEVPTDFKGKIVDISKLKVPIRQNEATARWIRLAASIPPGRAFVTTEKAMGYGHNTVRSTLAGYQHKGQIPKTIRVSSHKREDGDYDIWIMNELPKEKESKQKDAKEASVD
jgi:hypothetical protein